MSKSIFEKIIDREIPAQIIHETSELLAFRDINPQAPVHFLVIPKKRFHRIAEVPAEENVLLGNLLLAAAAVARQEGLESGGYRIVINNGINGGETVPHLHVHVLGGRALQWPPG
ncbi:MAG: HIT domain-containing protein [Verrucomicrobiales bacterium]|jgi:histidine triad (HIT) family protein|nr:HIT domain-containing protein [Verrucomicrobiales bacterium]